MTDIYEGAIVSWFEASIHVKMTIVIKTELILIENVKSIRRQWELKAKFRVCKSNCVVNEQIC